jgi:hypothetical protein
MLGLDLPPAAEHLLDRQQADIREILGVPRSMGA